MKKNDFKKYQKQAINLCYDYETTTPESDIVALIWFTPQQLMKFIEYVMNDPYGQNSDTDITDK